MLYCDLSNLFCSSNNEQRVEWKIVVRSNIVVSIDSSMSSSKALICLSFRLPCYTLFSLYTPHMLTILSIICGRASARSSKSGGELRRLYMWCGRRPTTMMMMMKKRRERREYKVNSQFLIAQPSASFSVCLELEQHTALSARLLGCTHSSLNRICAWICVLLDQSHVYSESNCVWQHRRRWHMAHKNVPNVMTQLSCAVAVSPANILCDIHICTSDTRTSQSGSPDQFRRYYRPYAHTSRAIVGSMRMSPTLESFK